MARLNILNIGSFARPRTHEGAAAKRVSNEAALRRAVLACMLWEDQFYEDGVAISGRIAELVPKVSAFDVAGLAVEAREKMKLRHAPLLLVREMARTLQRLHEEEGRTILLVEQYVAQAVRLADFVYILHRGQLAWAGEPDELRASAVLVESYLGAEV